MCPHCAIFSRELHEAFTPAGTAEVAWARGELRSPEHLLALLMSYQKLGYLWLGVVYDLKGPGGRRRGRAVRATRSGCVPRPHRTERDSVGTLAGMTSPDARKGVPCRIR